MKWYNAIGLLIILFDIIGGILGYNNLIFKGMSFGLGLIVFGLVLMLGLVLTFIDLDDIELELEDD